MNDLQLELLKKKEKLAELKLRKQERDQGKLAKKLNPSRNEISTQTQLNNIRNYKKDPLYDFENLNVDEILSKCGIVNGSSKYSENNPIPASSSSSFISVSVSSSSQSLKSNLSSTTLSNLNSSVIFKTSNKSEIENSFNLENLKLTSENNLNVVDIFPIETEKIKYSKETQTNLGLISNDENESTDDGGGDDSDPRVKNQNEENMPKKTGKQKPLAYYDDIFVYDTFQWEDEFTPLDLIEHEIINNENLDSFIKKALSTNLNELDQSINKNKGKIVKDYAENNYDNKVNNIDSNDDEEPSEASAYNSNQNNKYEINNDNVLQFLKIKRPIIERALKQNEKNIFFDYSAMKTNEKALDDSNKVFIKLKKSFCSADKSSIVTCLDWSQQYPELLLCSYDNMSFNFEEATTESIAAIWNSKSDQKIPYQNLTCSSLITSCIFSSYHSNLVIAGTYSGQIVMWDIRCNKQTPIQRSSLSISSHVNPVYCIKITGENDANNLISISNDGKLCSWSLDNLNLPLETQDLNAKNATNKSVYATCFDFQNIPHFNNKIENEANTNILYNRYAIVGSEDGLVHSVLMNLNNTSNNNNKYTTCETFNEHLGPITGVSSYNQPLSDSSNSYLSELFLTCSFDGCIKLWNINESLNPIHTFECNGDYVYDISWSPVHPALFACVDGSGKLDIWNLNNDFELPSASYELDNRTRALNKLKWSRNGNEIAVGDDHGQITIFELNENFIKPSTDESIKFLNTINTLKQLNYESFKSDKKNYLSESVR